MQISAVTYLGEEDESFFEVKETLEKTSMLIASS